MPYDLSSFDVTLQKPSEQEEDELTQVNFQLSRKLNWLLAKVADDRGISKSAAAREAVAAYVREWEFEKGIRKREWQDN